MKVLLYSKGAVKTLGRMPKHDGQALVAKLESYARGEPQDVIKLKGSDAHRLRHGDWRALLTVTKTEVRVEIIVNRREAYR